MVLYFIYFLNRLSHTYTEGQSTPTLRTARRHAGRRVCFIKHITVNLVIFACLNFREFLILGLFTKFRIHEFSFFFSSAIIVIIFARFLNSRICPPRDIREN